MTWAAECVGLAAALSVSPEVAERIERYQPAVYEAAAASGVDLDLLNGLIWVESMFRPRAVSSAGARGLGQIMPRTWAAIVEALDWPKEADPFAPALNARAAAWYLGRLLRRFNGRREWALAGYYAGPGNVAKRGPGPWLSYVRAVERAARNFRDGRLRCRGSELPPPSWGAPSRSRPEPRPKPRPTSAASSGGVGLALLVGALALAYAWGID